MDKAKFLGPLFLFIFWAFSCQAYQLVVDGGLGVFNSDGSTLSQDKFAKIGVQEDLWRALKERVNAGTWLDSRGLGDSSSAFTGYQLGFEVDNNVMSMSFFSGPTLISNPDGLLGGILQFNESLFLGVKDKFNDVMGIAYNHFSSAGIEMPNFGRDFVGMEIKFPL